MNKFLYLLTFLLPVLPCWAEDGALEDIIAEVNPSVLSITVDTKQGEQALGAGFVLSADGYAVTNAHVVEDAERINVSTIFDDNYEAQLVGADKKTDVALIKIKHPLGLEPVRFADSDNVRLGNTVFAIGNPYGLGNSVSKGIISAKERDIEKGPYDSFLQTDAAINQGNSGGPLFNTKGEVVGMSTAIFSLQGDNSGIGFATPSNMLQWIIEALKKDGQVIRGWLGMSVRPIRLKNDETVAQLAIAVLEENSPAATAGLKAGDVIERIGNISLKNPRQFSADIATQKPGTVLPAVIRRDGEILNIKLTVAEMPKEDTTSDNKELDPEGQPQLSNLEELGLDKSKINDAIDFSQIGIKAYFDELSNEFVIVELAPNSTLAEKGITVGSRLFSIDGKKIFGAEDLRIKLKIAAERGNSQLQFKSDTGVDTVTIRLEQKQ